MSTSVPGVPSGCSGLRSLTALLINITMTVSQLKGLLSLGLFAQTLRAAAPTSGKFSLLSMNVAGLPQILQDNDVPGDKATNAGYIGADFAMYDFDVINVQEVSS